MTVAHLSTIDKRTREAVMQELEWDPRVDATAISASAHEGVVTLTGYTDTCQGKLAAERVAKRVRGVRGVANDIELRLAAERTDTDIAADAVRALELRGTVPDTVQVVVHGAHITLTGCVRRLFHKFEAENAIRGVKGVRGIYNRIEVLPDAVARDIRHRIVQALYRNAALDAKHLFVSVEGNVATLKGAVTTWWQHDAAERAAAGAPGIIHVENRIVVEPPIEPIDEQC